MRDVDVSKKSECRHVRRTYRACATHGHPGAVRQRLESAAKEWEGVSMLDRLWFGEKNSTDGKYETKYDTNATHCIAPQTSVPRYECFCTRWGAHESVLTGVRRFRPRFGLATRAKIRVKMSEPK